MNAGRVKRLAVKIDFAGVPLVKSAQDFHQGGLTRAVFAHQRVDGAAMDSQTHPVQRLDTGKLLSDIRHLEQHVVFRSFHGLESRSCYYKFAPFRGSQPQAWCI